MPKIACPISEIAAPWSRLPILIAMAIPLKEKDGDKALLLRAEHALHPWVAFLVLPLFAFANSGVSLAAGQN